MKIVAISDIHGCLDYLPAAKDCLGGADLILIAGDITNFGARSKVKNILDELGRYNSSILAVAGNCDLPAVDGYLSEKGVNLSGNLQLVNEVGFVGVAGCKPYSGILSHRSDEERFEESLKELALMVNRRPFVLVTHHPPFGTDIDLVPGGRHAGSRAIRSFIENYQPLLAVSGHIHESPGIDHILGTTVINPGPFRHGLYAYIELTDKVEKTELCRL